MTFFDGSLTVKNACSYFYGHFSSRWGCLIALIIYVVPCQLFSQDLSVKSDYYKDFQVSSSDDRGISLVVDIDAPERYLTDYGDSVYTLVVPFLIGVPPGSEAVMANVSGEEAVPLGQIGGFPLVSVSASLAEVAKSRLVRGQTIATVNIYPFRDGMLFRRIEVKIVFTPSGMGGGNLKTAGADGVFDNIFRGSVLNFRQMKNWPILGRTAGVARLAWDIYDFSESWFRITTVSEGLTRVTGQDLQAAGISLDNLLSDDIRLFYGGGLQLPVSNFEEPEEVREVAIMIEDGGDGRFDYADYFLFFAEGVDRWEYGTDSLPIFRENHYTDRNAYMLAVSGTFGTASVRVTTADVTPATPGVPIIDRGLAFARASENNMLYETKTNHIYDYYNWYWSDEPEQTHYLNIPHPADEEARVRLRAETRNIYSLLVNGFAAVPVSSGGDYFNYTTDRLIGGLNRFNIYIDSGYTSFLDYIEVTYYRRLIPANDELDVLVESGSGTAELVIENDFSADPYLFDLSDPDRPVMLEGAAVGPAEIRYQYDFPGGRNHRFYLSGATAISGPYSIEAAPVTAPVQNVTQTDMIIIAPESMVPLLEDYRQYRQDYSGLAVQVVALEHIMNSFASGLYDPTAIRNFLKFAYTEYPSPPPSGVLLVGDGTYDFENNLDQDNPNIMPPYIHPYDSTASDDNYVYFGRYGFLDGDESYCDTCQDRGYDMMIARWPVRNTAELSLVVEKVKSYEASTNFDPWRTTVTLVADDEYASGDYETLIHSDQTEVLERYHLPTEFRRRKIYLIEYPLNSEKDKPAVNEAIIKSINDGTLLINYVGHGSPDTWAHEHVFNRSSDLQKLNNSDRLTVVFTASCSIGFFDNPTREGMAEEFLRLPGGAVGVVAATRLVYATENHRFNVQVFDVLFGFNDLSIGQSIFLSKLLRQYGSSFPQQRLNDRKYAYFGDPFLKLGIPAYGIEFTDYPRQLRALSVHQAAGRIIDRGSGATVDFDGEVEIFVYDSEILKTYRGINDAGEVADTLIYSRPGPIIFKGVAPVADGRFDFTFTAPLDIGYGGSGARISAYASSAVSDAFGLADSITVSEEIADVTDSLGPEIEYGFSGRREFISGDVITPGETMIIRLFDSSGINLTGGTGHGITLTVDGAVENIVNLTDLFRYDEGSYTAGEIQFDPGDLESGRHDFKIKAWDNANNSSVTEFTAEVMADKSIALADLMNYPNPMEDTTMFSFILTVPAQRVTLEIFTVSGRRIFKYEESPLPAGYNEFYVWDGRDADGDRVATGVYIYKATAYSTRADETVESYSKVVVIN